MSDIRLNLNGISYGGWKSIQINKSVDQITNAFGISVSDLNPGKPDKWNIKIGDECTITVDNQAVITGYIEAIPISYSATSHSFNIEGRDKTCDLVDCSYVGTGSEWLNQSIEKLIKTLCEPFSIDVEVDSGIASAVTTPIDKFVVDQGETVGELISKLCRMAAIIPISLGDGKLTLTRAGINTAHDPLELGKNVKTADFSQSNRDRYSLYIAKGQGNGNDNKTVADVTNCTGRAEDKIIAGDNNRYRPLIILADRATNNAECKNLARWESRVRAGNSRKISYEVQGWTQSNGDIWQINSLVKVKDYFLNFEASLLISGIEFSLDDDAGSVTRITVVDPTTYKLTPEPITKTITKATGFDPRVDLSR